MMNNESALGMFLLFLYLYLIYELRCKWNSYIFCHIYTIPGTPPTWKLGV